MNMYNDMETVNMQTMPPKHGNVGGWSGTQAMGVPPGPCTPTQQGTHPGTHESSCRSRRWREQVGGVGTQIAAEESAGAGFGTRVLEQPGASVPQSTCPGS